MNIFRWISGIWRTWWAGDKIQHHQIVCWYLLGLYSYLLRKRSSMARAFYFSRFSEIYSGPDFRFCIFCFDDQSFRSVHIFPVSNLIYGLSCPQGLRTQFPVQCSDPDLAMWILISQRYRCDEKLSSFFDSLGIRAVSWLMMLDQWCCWRHRSFMPKSATNYLDLSRVWSDAIISPVSEIYNWLLQCIERQLELHHSWCCYRHQVMCYIIKNVV